MKKTLLFAAALLAATASNSQQKADVTEHSAYIQAVDEYVPAPGQFINTLPKYVEGDDAAAMAQKCTEALANNAGSLVSLGAYGGYITFHFDHSIANVEGQGDIYIKGNAFSGSSEPGIVMVSKDVNHNGIADDPWYELKGSADTDCPDRVTYGYEISYTLTPMENTPWTDNQGGSGTVDRNSFHSQEYFPLWLDSPLQFKGTLLPKNGTNTGGEGDGQYWVLSSLAWGYVDSQPNSNTEANSFDISWAVDENRQPVKLDFVDFVRVYTAVNQVAGWLGETSTEVAGAEDLHLEASLAAIDEALKAATFEDTGIDLGADGYFRGDENGEPYDNWGTTAYHCTYQSGAFQFAVNYTPDWDSWSGFSISNRTATTYENLTPDQYNSCTGKGHNGSDSFIVASLYGEDITTVSPEGIDISSLYLTNAAYTLNSILNGDPYSGDAFGEGDWLLLTITGTRADNTTATVETYLADYRAANAEERYYLGGWQWIDLSSLGKVNRLSFSVTGSRNNIYGLLTPAYFCLDDLHSTDDGQDNRVFAATDGIAAAPATRPSVVETGRYSADGKRLSAPAKGLNIIRFSDGSVRKVFLK